MFLIKVIIHYVVSSFLLYQESAQNKRGGGGNKRNNNIQKKFPVIHMYWCHYRLLEIRKPIEFGVSEVSAHKLRDGKELKC